MTPDTADEEHEYPGLLICVPCEQYVPADKDAEVTACDHSWDDACDVSDFDGEERAKFRHDVFVKELEREEPRSHWVKHEYISLMFDLTMADVLPDDYADREGLECLLVMSADKATHGGDEA